MTVYRRTFEANSHPAGSAERAELNCDARTSEYMPSHRYCSIGEHHRLSFRTKAEAEAFEEACARDDASRSNATAVADWQQLMEGCEFMLDGAWSSLTVESGGKEPENGVVGIKAGQVWGETGVRQ